MLREHRFTMVMTPADKAMLDALAQAEERSAAAWIRAAIKAAYNDKFGTGSPLKGKRRPTSSASASALGSKGGK
jgi:hypothetical protein